MKTIKKILSLALCLALVMSYVPMISLNAFAADCDHDFNLDGDIKTAVTCNTCGEVVYESDSRWTEGSYEGFIDGTVATFKGYSEGSTDEIVAYYVAKTNDGELCKLSFDWAINQGYTAYGGFNLYLYHNGTEVITHAFTSEANPYRNIISEEYTYTADGEYQVFKFVFKKTNRGTWADGGRTAYLNNINHAREQVEENDEGTWECYHTGGTATCMGYKCEKCDHWYGEADKTKHTKETYTNGFRDCCGEYQSATGSGTESNPYQIANAGQLYWFAQKVNSGEHTLNASLTADIVVNETVFDGNGNLIENTEDLREWGCIDWFYGNFNGNGHTIRGLYARTTGEVSFIRINYGTVSELNVEKSYLESTDATVGFINSNNGTIINCSNNIKYKAYVGIGGIAYSNNGTISSCYFAGEYSADSVASAKGAIVAHNFKDVLNCYYLATEETDSIDGTTYKTAEQFASGEVAYLLQQGNTEQVWGQDNNREGATPILDSTGIYRVVEIANTGNYSVSNVGDINGDGIVNETDYQALVNKALAENHEQIETASYDDIIKYDLDGNGYLNVLDASLMERMLNGHISVVDVYAVGDYNLNGIAFEEADLKAIKHAIENPEKLATYKKYASDINGDGKVDENDLTALTAKYGEVTGTECVDNVEVYYRWGNKYSTCTATAICTLCGEKVATETVNTTSETLSELTCTQDGKVKYTATFQNELFEGKVKTVTTPMLPHDLGELKDNGDGTHSKSCVNCDYVESESNEHSFDITNGECVCGAKEMSIDKVTVAGWDNGGTINAGLAEKADDALELSGRYFEGFVPEGELVGSANDYKDTGVTVTNENNNLLYQADNIRWNHNGSGWYSDTIAPLWDNNTVVYAYYPYIADNASSSLSYMLEGDLLYGSAVGTTGNLTLERKLASLVLKPTLGSEIGISDKINQIWISGIYTEGTFDAKTGILTTSGAPEGTVELKNNGDGTWETRLIPMSARTVTLTIRMVHGEYYTTTVELPAVEAGKQYDMTVQVGKSKVNEGALHIKPWASMTGANLENDGNTHGAANEFPDVWLDVRDHFNSGEQITLILTDGTTSETHILTVNEYGYLDSSEIITAFSSGRYYAYYGTNVSYDAESGLTVTVPTDQSTAEKLAAAEALICEGTFESNGYIDLIFEKPQAKLIFNVGYAGFDANPTLSDIQIHLGDTVIDAYLDGNRQIVAYIPEAELYCAETLITMKVNGRDAVVYLGEDYYLDYGTAYSFNLTVGNPE